MINQQDTPSLLSPRTPEITITLVGYLKGKSAIAIARQFKGRQGNFNGEPFWARGYFVSTVGLDEEMVRVYIRNQEKADEHREQLRLGMMCSALGAIDSPFRASPYKPPAMLEVL